MALYTNEAGTPVTTQSMMKTFLNCPREAYYKYHLRLSPKVSSLPLEQGKWMHSLLESYYKGEDWKETHKILASRFNQLFDEEKEELGDLPAMCEQLMQSYIWHYGDPQYKDYHWKVHEVELKLEAEMPNGHLFRGVFDLLVEDEFGLWLVDHKNQRRFPNWEFRMLDMQSPMYIWLLRENGIPVNGFIWNYLRTSGFPKMDVLKSGKSFYARSWNAENDYYHMARSIKQAQGRFPEFLEDEEEKQKARERLAYLKSLRWSPDEPQAHPFFRREVIEKSEDLIDRALKSAMRTSDRMHSYDFSDPDYVERNVNQCKGFMCSYRSLTMADFVSGDSTMLQKQGYKHSDPLAYQDGNDQLEGG